MQNVNIRVVSTASDGSSKPMTTENKYTGTLTEKNGKYYCLYEENEGSGLEGTKTTIKWEQNRVILIRSGAINHRQEFCVGLEDHSLYKTPYLEIPLLTETKYLNTYFLGGCWCLEMEYSLKHSGELYGDMKILIEIREAQVSGH